MTHPINQEEIREVLEEKGAILRGHFLLSSGRHSDLFVQKFRVLEHPRLAQRFGEVIASEFGNDFDVVASPAIGAVVLGFAVALAGDARFIFAERAEGQLRFRRGFEIAPGERVLIVEDVVTTGTSVREVIELVHTTSGRLIGVGALIDRGDPARMSDIGVPLRALLGLDVASWDPSECPMCARGEPVTDPGSRRLHQ
jgi:orotate phosphoribosyltransferase